MQNCWIRWGFVALSVLAMSACAPLERDYRAPNYASPVGDDDWEVVCGRNRFIIDDAALDDFYDEDGSRKSYMEFCRDEDS